MNELVYNYIQAGADSVSLFKDTFFSMTIILALSMIFVLLTCISLEEDKVNRSVPTYNFIPRVFLIAFAVISVLWQLFFTPNELARNKGIQDRIQTCESKLLEVGNPITVSVRDFEKLNSNEVPSRIYKTFSAFNPYTCIYSSVSESSDDIEYPNALYFPHTIRGEDLDADITHNITYVKLNLNIEEFDNCVDYCTSGMDRVRLKNELEEVSIVIGYNGYALPIYEIYNQELSDFLFNKQVQAGLEFTNLSKSDNSTQSSYLELQKKVIEASKNLKDNSIVIKKENTTETAQQPEPQNTSESQKHYINDILTQKDVTDKYNSTLVVVTKEGEIIEVNVDKSLLLKTDATPETGCYFYFGEGLDSNKVKEIHVLPNETTKDTNVSVETTVTVNNQ